MSARRKKAPKPLIDNGFTYESEVLVNGRWLRPGTEFRVRGERGRFRFTRLVTNRSGVSWIDCFGSDRHYRAFYPDRVARVHIHKRTREGAGA
jgi:hypothetical protein